MTDKQGHPRSHEVTHVLSEVQKRLQCKECYFSVEWAMRFFHWALTRALVLTLVKLLQQKCHCLWGHLTTYTSWGLGPIKRVCVPHVEFQNVYYTNVAHVTFPKLYRNILVFFWIQILKSTFLCFQMKLARVSSSNWWYDLTLIG